MHGTHRHALTHKPQHQLQHKTKKNTERVEARDVERACQPWDGSTKHVREDIVTPTMKNRKTGRRRRNASQTSPRTLLVCGLLFAFVVFEFWVMHHHAPSHDGSPTRHHYYPLSKVPVGLSIGVDDKHESPALPREPSLPGSMREPSVPAHDRNHAVDQPRSREEPSESKDSGDIAVLGLPPRPPPLSEGSGSDDEGYGDMRVAVLVPYSGPGLPLWFDAFTDLAAANRDLVDWIIFCEEV